MIRYDLKCDRGHGFDSWFASSAAYDKLRHAGCITCPVCGSGSVEKALMAPAVAQGREGAPAHALEAAAVAAEKRVCDTLGPEHGHPRSQPIAQAQPQPDRAQTLAALKEAFERQSEYVGLSFAAEARRIHAGETPERLIHGEARLEEARALLDEGVPIAPLPFIPTRRTN